MKEMNFESFGVSEMTKNEMKVIGGGWFLALVAFLVGGLLGLYAATDGFNDI